MIYAGKKIKGIKYTLTQKQPHSYDGSITAKNSDQNWSSELFKMHSRILYGFFYVCKIRYVMTGCREELSGSPRSLDKWYSNFIQPVTPFNWSWKRQSHNPRRLTMSINPTSGNPSAISPDLITLQNESDLLTDLICGYALLVKAGNNPNRK